MLAAGTVRTCKDGLGTRTNALYKAIQQHTWMHETGGEATSCRTSFVFCTVSKYYAVSFFSAC